MFHLYHHHDLDRLAALLGALRARDAGTPLAPERVLVPNRGVGRWLQMRLAERRGIAANIDFPLPARFFWWLLSSSLPDAPDSSAYQRERLRWHLYAELPAMAGEVPEVARYLSGAGSGGGAEVRRLQLAERLADVFDEYLIYRRDMLAAWERGEGERRTPADWQAPLWRAVVARLGERHRARLLTELIEALERGRRLERGAWPERLYCFALVNLPPDYLRLLYALGREIEVHFLLPNPSEHYWGDIEARPVRLAAPQSPDPPPGEAAIAEDHPLLAALGRSARDFLRVLYAEELREIHEPELGAAMAYEPPGEETLLQRLQSGLLRMEATPARPGMAADDASLQLHACHGPLREIQVLKDQLLDLLGRDATLEPRDILVMLPDVAAYAPAIHSVFGAARGRGQGAARESAWIPYHISDRPRLSAHPIVLTFRRVLELPLSRWTASEILALAAVPAVMRRFELEDGDLERLRGWLEGAGVRWGLDDESRAVLGAGRWSQHSWRFGLDRLLLGLAQSQEEALVDGVAPWSDLEGGAAAALGRFWLLIERLAAWRDRLGEPAGAAAWQERLNAMIAELFAPDPDDAEEAAALALVHDALRVLEDAEPCLGATRLSWEALREVLLGELEQSGERQPFLAGGVTFCGMVPLRAVPFRVIAMLGMDDGAFPRQERSRSFNLTRLYPRLGDRNMRDDDRLLFLQSLLAARDVFYVSFTGQDLRSGEPLEPSPLLGELLDFLERFHFPDLSGEALRERLVTRQPMQPFSARYLWPSGQASKAGGAGPGRVFTFDGRWRAGTRAMHGPRRVPEPFLDDSRRDAESPAPLDLAALRAFLDHPPRYFLRERLRLELERGEQRLEDAEPLALDGLAAHKLREALFTRARTRGELPPEPDALIRAQGVLPPPPLDEPAYAELADAVNALLPVWRRWHEAEQAPAERLEVALTLADGTRLSGAVGDVYPDGLRRIRAGKLQPRHRLPHWLDYLALRAMGRPGALWLAGLDEDGALQILGGELAPQTARAHLAELCALYREGQCRALPFLPSLGAAFLEAQSAGVAAGDPLEALRRLNRELANSHSPPWQMRDAYFGIVVQPPDALGADPATSEFCRIAETVCAPLLEHLRVVEDSGASAP